MPSELSLEQALEAVSPQREAFRSAVATAADQIEARLRAYRAPQDGRAAHSALELGQFASGRLDAGRFGAMFAADEALDPLSLARLEGAHETMRRLVAAGDDLFVVRRSPGSDPRAQVGAALAEVGRAFAAARTAENVRLGRHPSEEADFERDGFAFQRWNRAERQISPPLIVEVDGGDLQAGGLAEFLVGEQKIVLLVGAPAPVAPLVRLITPGVFVLQTTDAAGLSELRTAEGPAVAALLPEGAARFVHRPGGEKIWDRLEVQHIPEQARSSVRSVSLFQQREELEQLRLLAIPRPKAPVAGSNGTSAAAVVEPIDRVDRVAAWLLAQADMDGAEAPEAS